MKVLVVAETRPGERRVALVPDVVGKLTAAGLEVLVETGAGSGALCGDEAYEAAGASVVPVGSLGEADVVVGVRPLDPTRAATLRSGAVSISFLAPSTDAATIDAVAAAGASALSFELVPRISRAQSMDALTSQALCAGYRAALVGAERLPKFFPLFMTAAGTVQPANVLVLGAGVAGLQAIATAKRLGARVSAYDVRPASADEVRSMGAVFVDLGLEALEGAGGYAREQSEDRARRQMEALAPFVAAADVLITTAAIPGRAAPVLVNADMVQGMRPGSVIVDLASETGGNVEGSVAGEELAVSVPGGSVTLWGGRDVPSQLPVPASRLYAMNVVNLLLLSTKDGEVVLNEEDEIIDGSAVVLDGVIRKEVNRA